MAELADPQQLERELAAARDREQAVGRVLRAVASSQGLQSVLEEVVGAATRLCGGDYGLLSLAEGDVFRVVAHHGGAALFEHDQGRIHTRDPATAIGRVALEGRPVQIPDVLADADYSWPAQERIGYRAVLGVPIVLEEELIGAMAILRDAPGDYSDEEVAFVKTFADQAAIAIANARLLEAVERQLDQQRAIGDVLSAVARAEGLGPVFDAVMDAAVSLCRGDYGALYLAAGDTLDVAVQRGGSDEQAAYEREHAHPIDRRTLVGRVALTRAPVHIPDALSDPEYDWPAREMSGYRALVGTPVFVESELIGVIGVVRNEPEPFSDGDMELLKTFADQAAIAVANARLLDAVERQRAELSRFVSPQVAELVSSEEGEKLLDGHRAYITALFCDLRGFTAFAETAAPEELFEVLHDYHVAVGSLIPEYDGTFKDFAGDGLTVLFNDPVAVEDHELKAIRFALAAHERFSELATGWRKRGIDVGLGIGISSGYATLGRIGFEGRYDYGALGPVTNLASRLCSRAEAGQTLIGQRLYAAVEDEVEALEVGTLELKGFGRPVVAYEVRGLR